MAIAGMELLGAPLPNPLNSRASDTSSGMQITANQERSLHESQLSKYLRFSCHSLKLCVAVRRTQSRVIRPVLLIFIYFILTAHLIRTLSLGFIISFRDFGLIFTIRIIVYEFCFSARQVAASPTCQQ